MQLLRNPFLVLLTCLSILCAGCFKSKNVVNRIPPANGKPLKLDGVSYALPRTIIKVALPFKRVDKTPGEFEPFTPCFFSEDVAASRIKTKKTTYTLNPPTFGSRGEPDPNEHYVARIKGGYFENKTMSLEFNDDGVITKGDVSSENVAIDVAIKAARTAVSIAATAASGGAAAAAGAAKTAQRSQLDDPQIDICRSIVVIEAASAAASSAEEAAKASGVAAASAAAANAKRDVEAAEQELAATTKEFLAAVRLVESNNGAAAAASAMLSSDAISLVDKVVCYASDVKLQTTTAAAAAMGVAPKEATEANEAAAGIDDRRKFIGMSDNAGFPLPSPPFPPGCYEQQPTGTGVSADAFANGYLQAKKRFERIEELSTQRERLVGGDSAPQGISAEALKKMLDELDATITSYQTTFFLGTKDSESWTANLEYRPGKSIVSTSYNTFQTSPVLLTFSKEDGVCETPESKLQGVIIHPDFVAARCPLTPANEQVAWLSLKRVISDDPYLGHMEAANLRDEQAGERGFYYRIPAKAIVTLEVGQIAAANQVILAAQSLQGQNWRINVLNAPAPAGPFFWPAGREVGRETMRVAQIGVVASIPASAAGRKTQYTIDFEESTGALRNFKLASNALLEKGLVDEIGGSAKDILAAKQARAKAKAEANDELAKKKRELELLQTDNLIDAEKKKKANSQP